MKKLLILIIIAAAAFFFFKDSADSPTTPNNQNDSFQPDPSSATFTFDDGATTLSNGMGEKKDAETGFSETVELLKERATGDLNADGKNDVVLLLARSGGGSGVFIYAAAYISGPVNYRGTTAIFLGDRISPQSISIENGVATVRYLDRLPDEAFSAEPTVPASEQFIYRDGAFRKQ